MKFVILVCVCSLAVGAPQHNYDDQPSPLYAAPKSAHEISSAAEIVPILRDDRIQEDDGRYNVDLETGNGIKISESGAPDGPEGAIIKAGQYEYTAPDGTVVAVKFVANENGFQPQSDILPIPPAFPHDIPQFVLDQIAFAAEEDAQAAASETVTGYPNSQPETPSQLYTHP